MKALTLINQKISANLKVFPDRQTDGPTNGGAKNYMVPDVSMCGYKNIMA